MAHREMIRHVMIAMVLLSSAILAQEKPKPHLLRVLAIGDPPPFVQEVRDGARYEVAPPEGSIPPRSLVIPVKVPEGKDAEPVKLPLRLRLGQVSQPIELPLQDVREIQLNREQGSKWLALKIPPVSASLALVCRGPRNWDEPRAIILADDPTHRTEGTVHFANLSGLTVGITLGAEKIRLDPGNVFSRSVSPAGPSQPLTISYPTADGGLETCLSSVLEGTRNGVRRIIIYTADGLKARSPVKVFQLEETIND
jgi:hypothetical protein